MHSRPAARSHENTTTPDVAVLVADGILFDELDYGRRIEERLNDAGLTSIRHDLTSAAVEQLPQARAYVLTGGCHRTGRVPCSHVGFDVSAA